MAVRLQLLGCSSGLLGEVQEAALLIGIACLSWKLQSENHWSWWPGVPEIPQAKTPNNEALYSLSFSQCGLQ